MLQIITKESKYGNIIKEVIQNLNPGSFSNKTLQITLLLSLENIEETMNNTHASFQMYVHDHRRKNIFVEYTEKPKKIQYNYEYCYSGINPV